MKMIMSKRYRYRDVILAALMVGAVAGGCVKLEQAKVDMSPSDVQILINEPVVSPATKSPLTKAGYDYYIDATRSIATQSVSDENNYVESPQTKADDSPITKAGTPFETTRNVVYGDKYPANWPIVVQAVSYTGNFVDIGWSGATTYFPQTEMVYTETAEAIGWTGSRFWPKNGKLAFQAYAPRVNESPYNGATIDATGVHFTNYTVALNGTQKDLMYSGRTVDQTKAGFTPGVDYPQGVQLEFKHALSTIVFTAKIAENLGDVIVKFMEVTLTGVKNQGTFAQNMTSNDVQDNGAATWALSPSAPIVDYDNLIITAEGVQIGAEKINFWENSNVADLLVMPQQFGDATLNINYTIQTNEASGAIPQSFSQRLADLTYYDATNSEIPGCNSFEIGKRYIFNLEIGIQKIRFQPVVYEWGGVLSIK